MGQIDCIRNILLDFFSKSSGKHFTDHTLHMYRPISPHCLCILLLMCKQWRHTQIIVYIHGPFGHAVFIK